MKNRIFFVIFAFVLFLPFGAFAELKYIETETFSNLPMIRVKKIDDFEAIIDAYKIPIVFLRNDSSLRYSSRPLEAFVIAQNTYFSFSLEGYKTLFDFRLGTNAKFKSAEDYEHAKSLGIEKSDFYYFYKNNSFRSLDDCKEAQDCGFTDSSSFYEAKKLGYKKYEDYKEYLSYTAKGFTSKDEYLIAKSKGFYNAKEYKNAMDAGFSDNEEYKIARNFGLKTKSDLTAYSETIISIDKILKDRKINIKYATIYYFIKRLSKSEMSISVLSKSLNEIFAEYSSEVRNALNIYVYENYVQNNARYEQSRIYYRNSQNLNINFLLSVENLKDFFKNVDFSKIGTYSDQSEIFKKK